MLLTARCFWLLQTSNSSFVTKWATWWQLAGFLLRMLRLSSHCREVQPKGHRVPTRDRASFWSLEHFRPPRARPFSVCSPCHWQFLDEEAPGSFIIFIWLMIHVLFVTAGFGTSVSKMVPGLVNFIESKRYCFTLREPDDLELYSIHREMFLIAKDH